MNILTVDLEQINKGIYEYIAINSKLPYLICSDNTSSIILAKCYEDNKFYFLDKYILKKDIIKQYYGCTLLSNNSLRLGEIEIR